MERRSRLGYVLRMAFRLLLCAAVSVNSIWAAGQEPVARETPVYIPIEASGVDCNKLFDAVSNELHWVAGSITAFTRALGAKVGGLQTLNKQQVDELIGRFPAVFSYETDPNTGQPALAVDVDQLADSLSDKKSRLRQWLADAKRQPIASLFKIDGTWLESGESPGRIVVVMAGLHGIESTSEAVARAIHQQTFLPCCVFAYPNDAPVAESAGLLVMELQDLHRQLPGSRITLVTHSMGGLVSRAALEMSRYGPTQRSGVAERTGVDQLIQVCPPNHGSALAEYGPLLEGAEQVYRLLHRSEERQKLGLMRTIIDGFNEASADIQPNSRFLKELNDQPRNPQVHYSIIAGNDGPLRPAMTGLLGGLWERLSETIRGPQEIDKRIYDILNCDELQRGRGDGVVALTSAKLDGVTDFRVLPIHHLAWNRPDSESGQRMIEAIAGRIGVSL